MRRGCVRLARFKCGGVSLAFRAGCGGALGLDFVTKDAGFAGGNLIDAGGMDAVTSALVVSLV
jgi:hypothetical protein